MPFPQPKRYFLGASLLALVALDAGFGQEPELMAYTATDDNARRLEQGEIVQIAGPEFRELFGEQAMRGGQSTLVLLLVDASEETTWSVFTNYEDQADFMPQMSSSSTVSRDTDDEGRRVCYVYEVLFVDTRACFNVEEHRETGTIVGVLDPEASDDQLTGVNYFWHMRPWRDDRLLLAYHQRIVYSGAFAELASDVFPTVEETAAAVRERVRARAAGQSR